MYVSLKTAADYFSVSYGTMRRLCLDGAIPFIRAGQQYRLNLDEVEKAMSAEKKKPYRPNFFETLRAM